MWPALLLLGKLFLPSCESERSFIQCYEGCETIPLNENRSLNSISPDSWGRHVLGHFNVYVWLSHPGVTIAYSLSCSSATILCCAEEALQLFSLLFCHSAVFLRTLNRALQLNELLQICRNPIKSMLELGLKNTTGKWGNQRVFPFPPQATQFMI